MYFLCSSLWRAERDIKVSNQHRGEVILMAGNVLGLLLWLFAFAQAVLVYRKALALFQSDDTTADNWIGLSIGSIFLIGSAWLVYVFGNAGIAHVTALLP